MMSTPASFTLLSLRIPGTAAVETSTAPASAVSPALACLTRKLAAGDEEAFREFHQQYFDRLYQFLLVVSRGNEDETKEALQLTLLRVVRYIRPFESPEAFWCWLKVLARSAARDAGRKQQRYIAVMKDFAGALTDFSNRSASSEESQLASLLQENLEGLDPADRGLIEGKYIDGFTVKELCAQTGLTEKAVESRLARVRGQLRIQILKQLQSNHP
jgi:RNA polymerase sigma-70 factor (ECF subfamily)